MFPQKTLFAGVAGLAIAAALAMPAEAQYRNRSTPAERAQTEQLNRNAADGEGISSGDASNYASAKSDYEAAQQRYQQQLDDYNAKTRSYEDQRRRYNEKSDTYSLERQDYSDQQQTYEDRSDDYADAPPPPARVTAAPVPSGLWSLDRFNNPNSELYNMPVVDADGITVGHFRRAETRDNGERMAVVTLNSMRTVALRWDDVFYDPDMAVVVAELTSRQIDRIPSGVYGP